MKVSRKGAKARRVCSVCGGSLAGCHGRAEICNKEACRKERAAGHRRKWQKKMRDLVPVRMKRKVKATGWRLRRAPGVVPAGEASVLDWVPSAVDLAARKPGTPLDTAACDAAAAANPMNRICPTCERKFFGVGPFCSGASCRRASERETFRPLEPLFDGLVRRRHED